MSNIFIGIDLGTTNSVIAISYEQANGQVVSKVVDIPRPADMYNTSGRVVLTSMQRPTISSCVYYPMENNYTPLVGEFAKQQYSLRPHLVAKSIKSQMGQPLAAGLSDDVPDKTPAQISSRILKILIDGVSRILRGMEIHDAVITVPANFDSSMCQATLDAASIAGIELKNPDGTDKYILLSEPKAVLYDLMNQIRNGYIPDIILDLNTKKRVLVFDLGGGTLDITLHEMVRRNDDVLKVDDIATNRYTQLGGDNFDEALAQEMYRRFLKKMSRYPDAVTEIERNKDSEVIPILRDRAEDMKLELSQKCGNDYDAFIGWDDSDDEEVECSVGCRYRSYAYDDIFTKQEIEDVLSVFMAKNLKYDDYKNLDKISNTQNIIYPILDVLKKASDKLGVPDVKVDAVILNGGMSKFYMVTQRLKEFFGFEPIAATDPDQAVARGAAVYHYYLNKYSEIKDDMQSFKDSPTPTKVPKPVIQMGRNILNDALYLGLKNGAVHEIIPTGAELPYQSPLMTGFQIEPGQTRIAIPIKSRNNDGSYRVIANSNMAFAKRYRDGAFVAFEVYMERNKILTMRAWTSTDEKGLEKIEDGRVTINIDNSEHSGNSPRVMPSREAILDAQAEIQTLSNLFHNLERNRNTNDRNTLYKRISSSVGVIYTAGNKKDFASPILRALNASSSDEFKGRLFTIARKIGETWTDAEKKRLASMCMIQIQPCLLGFPSKGNKVSADIQAIYTLSICADRNQLDKLNVLHSTPKYLQACLYTHAKTKTCLDWVYSEFEKDIKRASDGIKSNLQFSSHAIGVAFAKNSPDFNNIVSVKKRTNAINTLCSAIESKNLNDEILTCCIIALGCICDKRKYKCDIDSSIIEEALSILEYLDLYYSDAIMYKQNKARSVAIKMINGETLSDDEEQFLLTKLEL